MSLAEKWASFEKVVIPDDASATQRREMKKAFYGGAATMFGSVINLPDDEDASIAVLNSFETEIKAFVGV